MTRKGALTSLAIVLSLTGTAQGAPVSRTGSTVVPVVALDVGGVPTDVASAPSAVWVAAGLDGIVRVDPQTNTVVARIPTAGAITRVARGLGAVWALDLFGGRLLRIDPRGNRVTRTIPVDGLPSGLAIGHGLVWVASQVESTVSGIDPRTERVLKIARFARGELWPGGLDVGPDGVWVLTGAGNEVSLFDPETMTFRHRIRVVGARSLAVTGRSAWIGLADGGSLLRVRAGKAWRVTTGLRADAYGPSMTAAGLLWVAEGRRIAAIEPSSSQVVERLRLPSQFEVAAITALDDVWVVDAARAELVRLRVRERVATRKGDSDGHGPSA